MTAICTVTFRPAEMVQFDSTFNVWNAQWGLSNLGTREFQADANQKALLMPVAGLYRVTGSIMGSMDAAALAQAFVNAPPAQLVKDRHNPDYPFPYDLGARQQEAGTWITLPFCGLLQVQNANAPISFYMSNTFQPDDPHATILIELIQSS